MSNLALPWLLVVAQVRTMPLISVPLWTLHPEPDYTLRILDGLETFVEAAERGATFSREQAFLALDDDTKGDDDYAAAMYSVYNLYYGELYDRLLRYSLVMCLYSVFEARLLSLAHILWLPHGSREATEVSFDPFLKFLNRTFRRIPTDLDRVRRYLASVGVIVPDAEWAWARDLATVRKCVIHAGGSVTQLKTRDRAKLQAIVRRRPGLGIGNDAIAETVFETVAGSALRPVLAIGNGFVVAALKGVRDLFASLYSASKPGL